MTLPLSLSLSRITGPDLDALAATLGLVSPVSNTDRIALLRVVEMDVISRELTYLRSQVQIFTTNTKLHQDAQSADNADSLAALERQTKAINLNTAAVDAARCKFVPPAPSAQAA